MRITRSGYRTRDRQLRGDAIEKDPGVREHKDVRLAMNADRRKRFGTDGRMLALVCECVDADCRRTVLMSSADYDALRPGLVLHPDHMIDGEQTAASI